MKNSKKMPVAKTTNLSSNTAVQPFQQQLEENEKSALLLSFLNNIDMAIEIGFMNYGRKSSILKTAIKYNQDIITGEFPNLAIDYAKVIISKGSLYSPLAKIIKPTSLGCINVWWYFDAEQENPNDRATILMYNPDKQDYMFVTGLVRREDRGFCYNRTKRDLNCVMHVYLFFVSEDKKSVSDSIYLGKK
ncbi:DUF6266 family protein [Pedobacter sp. MC2016-15]|uniref:DUF6266 family protein n=1 Tax=Pedobacter sp. MC2016-15 TaxID=2994473 RepID=UPI00224722BC|nr:DUF6266 family protein [Pedobacter sp. MC2016-15]MCX2477996.1 DUF6266 family protein [Pedobacter sp. MC2016-15]